MAGPVAGRVVDPDNRPVARARVIAAGDGSFLRSTLTDERGEFALDLPDDGTFELRVAADGFRAAPLAVKGAVDPRDLGAVRLSVSAISEEVVVSAAQVEIPLSRASSSVTVITAAELLRTQVHSVADALRTVPGLTVTSNGGTGAVTSVFPRGGESNYTLVFIDDVPVNAFGGDYDFGHLSTENIDRIEVVRGPQSALFGSNAIGAVIRVVTRRGGRPAVRGSIEGGSDDAFRMAASTSGTRGAFDWGASADRLSTNNANGTVTAGGLIVSNDDYERTTGAVYGGWRRGETALRGQFRHGTDERGFPGPFGSNPIGIYTAINEVARGNNARTTAAASGSFAIRPGARVIVQTAYNQLESDFASAFGPSESNSNRWLVRGQVDFPLAPWLELSAGVELQRERTGSTFITGAQGQQVQVKRRTAGYFAEARWTATSNFFLTTGLRIDDIRRARLEDSPNAFSPRPVLDADSVVSVNPRAAVAWILSPDLESYTKLRGGIATGIRPPDGFELASTDNPGLKPERSLAIEGAVERALAAGRIQVDAVGFYNRYDDLIVTVGSFEGSSRYRSDNIANARSRGFELGLTARHRFGTLRPADLHARVAYTMVDSEVLALDGADDVERPFEVGQILLRRPRHQLSVEAGLAAGRLTTFLTGGARSHTLDIEPSFGTFGGLFFNQGFNVWNGGASWRLYRTVHLFGRVENLFDRRYEEAFGFPALGRRAAIGLRIAAGG